MSQRSCHWCGRAIEPDEGFRVAEPAAGWIAAFCRLEHIVPWAIQGPRWEAGRLADGGEFDGDAGCSHCGAPLGETTVVAVRHRGRHRVGDRFCSTDHLRAWASAGGRYR